MPKVLQLINRLNLGGPTFIVAYLSKYLSPEFETLLVAGMIDDTEASSTFITNEMGLKPQLVPAMFREVNPLKDLKAFQQMKKIIRDFNPDIVHTHAAKAGAIGRLAAAACSVPVILHTFHGHVFHSYFSKWKTEFFIRVERYAAKKSTRIIAISDHLKYEIGSVYRICPMEKIEVIPIGVDLKKFTERIPEKRKIFRDHYHIADNEVVIVIIGRLVPVKNHDMFLRVLKNVSLKTTKKIRAFIVGDGEDREKLESFARDLQIDFTDYKKNPRRALLTFTSWIKEIDEVYAGSDIVALTSLNEGTPVSLIEAQAAGKPIVTTNVGGIPDIIYPEFSAYLIPVNDEELFAEKLLTLIENDVSRVDRRLEISNEILKRFDYRRLVSDTRNLYQKLLSGNGAKSYIKNKNLRPD